MRAYLIDPELQTITEIDFGGGCDAIYRIIGCEWFKIMGMLNGSLRKGFDTIYVTDNELDSKKHCFQFDTGPVAGKGLVVGFSPAGVEGYCDARISLDQLTRRIQFTQRKFRGVVETSCFEIIEEQ